MRGLGLGFSNPVGTGGTVNRTQLLGAGGFDPTSTPFVIAVTAPPLVGSVVWSLDISSSPLDIKTRLISNSIAICASRLSYV